MAYLNRRHLLAGLGASVVLPRAMPAIAASSDTAERLAGLMQAGKVPGLHAFLVNQGGKLVFEHYGRGADERLGAARRRRLWPRRAARSALRLQERRRSRLWHCARGRQGAATGRQALRAVSGICRSCRAARPRQDHDPPCALDDARLRMGRAAIVYGDPRNARRRWKPRPIVTASSSNVRSSASPA